MKFSKNNHGADSQSRGLDQLLADQIGKLVHDKLGEALDPFLILLKSFISHDPLDLLDISRLKELLGISKPTIYRLIKSGKLKTVRLGQGEKAPLRFRRSDIENFINTQKGDEK